MKLAGATAKLDNQSAGPQTVGSLAGVTGSEVKLTRGGLVAGDDDSSTTFAGILCGTNGFTKAGLGTLTLAGTNSHTGGLAVNGGVLLVNSNSVAASGPVVVASGATLGGTGTLGGATAVQAGGLLSPGVGIGTLAFTNSLTLAAGCTNIFEISKSPLTNDAVNISGALTNGGTLIVTNLSPNVLAAGDNFKLFSAGSYNGVFAVVNLPALGAGLAWNTNALNTNGLLTVVSVVPPRFGSASLAGSSLVFTITNGTPAAGCYVLSSTNLLLPLTNWTRLATNVFDANGAFSYTNVISANVPQNFYRMFLP